MLNLISRQALQVARIAQGVQNGSLTRPELAKSAQALQAVHQNISTGREDGGIAPGEFLKDQLLLKASSTAIFALKHDGVSR